MHEAREAVLAALRKAEDDLMPEADQPRKIEVGMKSNLAVGGAANGGLTGECN